MMQILYERGWICEEQLDRYKTKVVDDAGLIVKEYSLGHLLETCTDFSNERLSLNTFAAVLEFKFQSQPNTMLSTLGRALNILGELPKRYIDAIHYIPKKEKRIF
jgi:hypothetical protein